MTRPQAATNRFFVTSEFALYYRRAKQFHWQNQITSNYLVISVFTGELDCLINENRIRLVESRSLIIEPNVRVDASGKPVECVFLNLAPSLVIEHAIAMRLSTPLSTVAFSPQVITSDTKLNEMFGSFVSELKDEKPGKEIVMRALAEQTLVHMLRKYSTTRRSDELELSRVGLVDRRIRRSVELMHAQLDQELSLKAIAAASYLSPFHFSRLFKKLTGSTPHNYLAVMRANRAQLLLAETEMSVTEIGARVGYLSASHFTKAFRLATGTTPREFRKALISR
jgi:AraC family transcriptional regulator